jgi:hypothetical protein
MKIFGQKELPKKYQQSFHKGLKSGSAQLYSDTHCIVVDEILPEGIIQAADQEMTKSG